MLRIAIPKGSLERGTFDLFENAGLPIVRKSERNYQLKINDPRISEALLLRPQEIPRYVAEGELDLGICGLDWIFETGATVQEVMDLKFSKQSWSKVKIVLATDNANPITDINDISADEKVITEYPRLTRRFFRKYGKRNIKIRFSYGATEVKVPRFANFLVDVTETGETLKRNNKRIIATILESSTKLIANTEAWKNPDTRKAIDEIAILLRSVIDAVGKVLVKMNIPENKINDLVKLIPVLRPPTISPIYFSGNEENKTNEKWLMLETVVKKGDLSTILPQAKQLGAEDIVEIDVAKLIQ